MNVDFARSLPTLDILEHHYEKVRIFQAYFEGAGVTDPSAIATVWANSIKGNNDAYQLNNPTFYDQMRTALQLMLEAYIGDRLQIVPDERSSALGAV